jgi:hypothetical protein
MSQERLHASGVRESLQHQLDHVTRQSEQCATELSDARMQLAKMEERLGSLLSEIPRLGKESREARAQHDRASAQLAEEVEISAKLRQDAEDAMQRLHLCEANLMGTMAQADCLREQLESAQHEVRCMDWRSLTGAHCLRCSEHALSRHGKLACRHIQQLSLLSLVDRLSVFLATAQSWRARRWPLIADCWTCRRTTTCSRTSTGSCKSVHLTFCVQSPFMSLHAKGICVDQSPHP